MSGNNKKNCNKDMNDQEVDCVEVLEDDNRSIIMGIISQLKKGTDLSRVTLPTFVLEPRSMLEKLTDFMSHPDIILTASKIQDPLQRFVQVCKFFLSGWHVKPKGVKKPYNPILGEFFRCQYKLNDDTKAYYIAEQVSHHPPVSAYYYAIPEHGIFIEGEAHPKAKFLGNSAATIMKGFTRIKFSELNNETYEISNPNVYARGILFGKMVMEMGDQSAIKCTSNDLVCELEFKTKGFFSGQYHSVTGKIKRISTNELLYEISGVWTEELFIKKAKSSNKESLFNVSKNPVLPKIVDSLDKQEWNESRNVWSKVTAGILARDLDVATNEKTFIENRQREQTAIRQKDGLIWHPRFFHLNKKEEYEFKGVQGLDYKNLKQCKDHLDKQIMFPRHQPAVSSNNNNPKAHETNAFLSEDIVINEPRVITA